MSAFYDQQWAAGQPPLIVNLSGGGGGGTFTPDAVAGDLLPDADLTRNLGSASFRWSNLYANTLRPATVIASGNVTAANVSVSGSLVGASANVSGTLVAATITGGSATLSGTLAVSGALSALGDLAVTGALSVGSLTLSTSNIGISSGTSLGLTGAFSSASAAVSGALSAGSVSTTGNVAASGNVTAAGALSGATLSVPELWYVGAPIFSKNSIVPSTTALHALGTSSNRWNDLWVINADIASMGVGALTVVGAASMLSGLSVTGTLGATLLATTGLTSSGDINASFNVNAGGTINAPSLHVPNAYIDAVRVNTATDVFFYNNAVPGPASTVTVGKSGAYWNAGYITTLNSTTVNTGTIATNSIYTQFLAGVGGSTDVQAINNIRPTGSLTLGTTGARWTRIYADDLTVTNGITLSTLTLNTLTVTTTATIDALTSPGSIQVGYLGAIGFAGDITITNNLIPAYSTSLGATGSRWSKVWTDSLAVTNDISTGTLSTVGAATIGSTLTVTGALTSASHHTSGIGQFDGGMLGNVRAIGSFSESNTILQYEYNDLEDCTTIRTVRNSHSPRIELGYLGNKIRVTGGLYQGADSIGISNSMKNMISIYTNGTLVPDATTVTFAFTNTSESHGDQSVFDFNGVMPGILVFKKAGLVHISYTVRFDPNGTGFRQATLGRGDVSNPPTFLGLGTSGVTNVANVNATYLSASATMVVNADQYVTVYVYQNSGGSLVTVLNMSAVYL